MVNVKRTFDVQVNPSVAVDYLQDFANAEEWDPGTVSCTRTGDATAPVGVGSTWHNVSKLAGSKTELEYELREKSADRVLFVGTNKTATSYDDISVEPAEGGSRVTYEATVNFNGAAKLVDPLMKLLFLKLARDTVRDLTKALERL